MPDLHARLRLLEADHEPDGWPAVRMRDVSALLDELAAERERCAAICDRIAAESARMFAFGASKCAEGIRGEAPPG